MASAPTLMLFARRLAGGALSGSITRMKQATGTHLHRILGYSHIEGTVPTGEVITSNPFVVGGREWHLAIYPNGVDADHRGFISADLWLGLYETSATATYRVSLLDNAGNAVHSRVVGPCWFKDYGSAEWTGVNDLVVMEEQKRSVPFLHRNDCLNIQCDVAMMKMEPKHCNKCFMRLDRAINRFC
ncbi:hypothetical protein BAE44_0003512 [Dichanthelium oligosanthes]|uniref:MATH domain-containing protein n=1 Tax=Dichanthelium oligosanthes TaxID=888268 RepID=A0A1E5WDI9_9POAL|nr:hypothetical protein BAE44_0003512 [Dichanthelium oligosanthes]